MLHAIVPEKSHHMEEEPSVLVLSDAERRYLIQLARRSLVAAVHQTGLDEELRRTGALGREGACFVTLRTQPEGTLRGCRGECPARRPLVDSVCRMAAASALDDPRFLPLKPAELGDISIEINVLTPTWPVAPEEIEVGRHGLLLVSGWHAGLLLPSVATSFGWDTEDLLRGLCRKAGLEEDAWEEDHVKLYAFESETWGE